MSRDGLGSLVQTEILPGAPHAAYVTPWMTVTVRRLPGQVTQPPVGLSRAGTKSSLLGFHRVPFPVVNLEKGVRETSECKETWGRWPLA